MTELWERSAGELAAMIRSQGASSREIVEAHIDRIGEVNGVVNAITRTLDDTALAAADAAAAAIADGAEVGPLHGVPFTIKENIDCVGSPTTNGVPAFADVGLDDGGAGSLGDVEGDQTIPAAAQRAMETARATKIVSFDTDHSPFLSAPEALAQVLVNVAEGASTRM